MSGEAAKADGKSAPEADGDAIVLGSGSVKFVELDAEKMGEYFGEGPNQASFDCVWISEAMSHLPDKALFFRNAHKLLKPGGRLVIADVRISLLISHSEILIVPMADKPRFGKVSFIKECPRSCELLIRFLLLPRSSS